MAATSPSDEIRYRVFRILGQNPQISQRELAHELGISLGKANYCLRELIMRGFVKARNFKNSHDKRAYMYYLTPKGIEEKALVTYRFVKYKLAEFQELRAELDRLSAERPDLAVHVAEIVVDSEK